MEIDDEESVAEEYFQKITNPAGQAIDYDSDDMGCSTPIQDDIPATPFKQWEYMSPEELEGFQGHLKSMQKDKNWLQSRSKKHRKYDGEESKVSFEPTDKEEQISNVVKNYFSKCPKGSKKYEPT